MVVGHHEVLSYGKIRESQPFFWQPRLPLLVAPDSGGDGVFDQKVVTRLIHLKGKIACTKKS